MMLLERVIPSLDMGESEVEAATSLLILCTHCWWFSWNRSIIEIPFHGQRHRLILASYGRSRARRRRRLIPLFSSICNITKQRPKSNTQLLTRTTTTRGEPPLKKLQKKFTSFALETEKDSENYAECERLAKAFLQELKTFELPLVKTKAVIDANVREKENFNELNDKINRKIVEAHDDIEDLKKQLEESKVERKHKEECETIRKLIAAQPPRSQTQKLINELEKEIASLEAENTASSRTLELRKKQFALLLHVVDELQNTIEEEQKSMMEEMRMAIYENKNIVEDATVSVTGGNSETPMAID
ncbi:unnamed protein product [Lactuca virosa]|uniref:THO complex subunit 7A n=1 Tax=Lactuca virosa TaxID=75947 RepID=A0AAU9NSH7_9ASTR|nr:unnamed protein product [Lactuca virosa]